MNKPREGAKRRRWLRWTGYLALVGLGLIAFGLVSSLWSQAKGRRLLAAEVARIKADGIELDWRKFKLPTEADETAALILKVHERFDPTNLRRGFPTAGTMIGPGAFLPASERSEWQYMDMLQGRMTTNRATWASFEAATGPYLDELDAVSGALAAAPPVFQMDYGTYPEAKTRHDGAALELVYWLCSDALRHLRAGHAKHAHRSLLALVHLSAGVADVKLPFSMIAATSVQNLAWAVLNECVGEVKWTPEQWQQVQAGFELVDWTASGRELVQLETAAGWHLFERLRADITVGTKFILYSTPDWWHDTQQGLVDRVGSGSPDFADWLDNRLEAGAELWTEQIAPSYWRNHLLPEDAIAFLQRSQLALRALRQLPDDATLTRFARTNDWDNWMAEYDDAAQARPHVYQVSAMLGAVSAGEKFLNRFLVAQHRARLAATVCAIQRHVLTRGAPPAHLAGLVPDFMPAVPMDPGDGQPLRYRLHADDTWQLYSTGLNGTDDGGDGNPVRGRGFYSSQAKDVRWPRRATPEEVAAYEQSRPVQPTVGNGE